MFYQIILASLVGSVFALIGGIILLYHEAWAKKISLLLISFAAGSLLGAAFFELLPEVLETLPSRITFTWVVLGILTIFLFEKFLKWYHCHDRDVCDYHTFSGTVIFGDTLHNFLDGITIAFSFAIGVPVGIATTIAIFFHEVPQEIGDFGVLLHAGYTRAKVFLYNLLAALATPLGAILGYLLLPVISQWMVYFLSFTAGTFIYIAASDLIPEVRHQSKAGEFKHVFMIIAGLAVIWSLGILIPE